ncbi:MAG: hypothetical protein LBT20_03750 [Clostridiales bacterium]|jgi:cytochrome c biogenesis factor|nr:hypothetical protein [Clostridiales bacterium]
MSNPSKEQKNQGSIRALILILTLLVLALVGTVLVPIFWSISIDKKYLLIAAIVFALAALTAVILVFFQARIPKNTADNQNSPLPKKNKTTSGQAVGGIVIVILLILILLGIFVPLILGFRIDQKYIIIAAVVFVLLIVTALIVAYSKNRISKNIAKNPNALKTTGIVLYSEDHTYTQKLNKLTVKYRTGISTVVRKKPLTAITSKRHAVGSVVEILYLKNKSYCAIAGDNGEGNVVSRNR